MKRIFILILCMWMVSLNADSENELDLGDVVIQGTSSNLADSVSYQRDLTTLNSINRESDLSFRADFSPLSVPAYKPVFNNDLALQLSAGNDNAIGKAVWEANKYLQLAVDYGFRKIDEDWDQQRFNLLVDTHLLKLDPQFIVYQYSFKDTLGKTDLSSYELNLAAPSWRTRIIEPMEISLNSKIAYQTINQSYSEKQEMLNFAIDINAVSEIHRSRIKAQYLKKAFSGFLDFGLNNDRFGSPAIWLGYDKNHVYPSIFFDRSWNQGRGFSFRIANLPHITSRDRRIELNENYFQTIKDSGKQGKKQLNAFAAVSNEAFLPITFYYNSQLIRDKKMYVSSPAGYYISDFDDRFIQSFGAEIFWKYQWLQFKHSILYRVCDEVVYFEPNLQLSNTIIFEINTLTSSLAVDYLADRKDDLKVDLDDIWQVDLDINYLLYDDLNVFGKIENLLNKEQANFSNIPKQGIRFYLGCRYSF